jgi:hypothetical protein
MLKLLALELFQQQLLDRGDQTALENKPTAPRTMQSGQGKARRLLFPCAYGEASPAPFLFYIAPIP